MYWSGLLELNCLTGTYDTLQSYEMFTKVVKYVDSLAVRTYTVCLRLTTLPNNCHFESCLLKNAKQNLRYHTYVKREVQASSTDHTL